jgi:ribonuclease D
LIAEEKALTDFVAKLSACDRIAIDTEADSLHCYFEKVCLIQISGGSDHVLVDPLAEIDLQPLYDLVCSRWLVFHGADCDLRLLRRTGKFEPVDLFDTMIASRLLGKTAFGLAALVKEYFSIDLSKASQKANWAIRPLPQEMLEYAINDTRYLLEIADILEGDLQRMGRLEWFYESRDRMIAKFKRRFVGVDPDQLQLFKLDDKDSRSSGEALKSKTMAGRQQTDSRQTTRRMLAEACASSSGK